MADIIGAIVKMNDIEINTDSAHSEALLTKVGANINGLVDLVNNLFYPLRAQSFTSSGNFTVPAGVTRVICIGVGGGGGGGGGVRDLSGGTTIAGGGGNGGSTTFNGSTVAAGGRGGGPGVSEAGPPAIWTDGIGFDGGSTATRHVSGIGARGHTLNGTTEGSGGDGGSAVILGRASGGGGGNGRIGVRAFSVTPSTNVPFIIGAGGVGGAGALNGGPGLAGSNGGLMVLYTLKT